MTAEAVSSWGCSPEAQKHLTPVHLSVSIALSVRSVALNVMLAVDCIAPSSPYLTGVAPL